MHMQILQIFFLFCFLLGVSISSSYGGHGASDQNNLVEAENVAAKQLTKEVAEWVSEQKEQLPAKLILSSLNVNGFLPLNYAETIKQELSSAFAERKLSLAKVPPRSSVESARLAIEIIRSGLFITLKARLLRSSPEELISEETFRVSAYHFRGNTNSFFLSYGLAKTTGSRHQQFSERKKRGRASDYLSVAVLEEFGLGRGGLKLAFLFANGDNQKELIYLTPTVAFCRPLSAPRFFWQWSLGPGLAVSGRTYMTIVRTSFDLLMGNWAGIGVEAFVSSAFFRQEGGDARADRGSVKGAVGYVTVSFGH